MSARGTEVFGGNPSHPIPAADEAPPANLGAQPHPQLTDRPPNRAMTVKAFVARMVGVALSGVAVAVTFNPASAEAASGFAVPEDLLQLAGK